MIQGYKDRMIATALSIIGNKRSEITNRYYGNATTTNFKICYKIWYVTRYDTSL